jgi:hypothetical protein
MTKKNSLSTHIMGMTKRGILLGVGSTVVTKAGAPSGVASSFGTMASFMPLEATVVGSGYVIKQARRLRRRR